MTLKFFKSVDDATKDFTKQSGYIFNELSKDVNKSAAFCNAFKQLSNKFIKTAASHTFPKLSADDGWGICYKLWMRNYYTLSTST